MVFELEDVPKRLILVHNPIEMSHDSWGASYFECSNRDSNLLSIKKSIDKEV